MSKEHLTYFKVENFKRFDLLELTDIGQFNLLVGDNNVGKTSVLEALLVDTERRKCLSNFHSTLLSKGLNIKPKTVYGPKGEVVEVQYPEENFLKYIFNDLEKSLKIEMIFEGGKDKKTITMSISGYPETIDADDFDISVVGHSPDNRYVSFFYTWPPGPPTEYYDEETGEADVDYDPGIKGEISGIYEHLLQGINGDFPLISTSLPLTSSLPNAYFEQVNLSRQKEKRLIEDMKFLLPEIEDFEVRKIGGEDQLLLGLKGKDELMPISIFGESVTRATQILLEISKYKGNRLMIDEIDTGIHYSRMKKFLKTIFQVAEKNEVQLFITTHSLECQQAFAEVFEESDMAQFQSKARQYTLIERPDGQITAIKRNWEQLEFALQTDNETRGGNQTW